MDKIQQYNSLLNKKFAYSEELILQLSKELLTEKRYNHVLRVLDKSMKLASLCQLSTNDIHRLRQTVLFHDFAKGMDGDELYKYSTLHGINLGNVPSPIYHAIVGAWIAQTYFCISDSEIIQAVYYHTTGDPSFLTNLLGALLFLADSLEDGRSFDKSHIEQFIPHDIPSALRNLVKDKICIVIKKERVIDTNSIAFYHSLLTNIN